MKHPRNVVKYFKDNPDEDVCYKCSECRQIISKAISERYTKCPHCDYPSRSRQIFHRKASKENQMIR